VVDAEDLAGAEKLPDEGAAETNVSRIIAANNQATPAWPVRCSLADDILYYHTGDTVPDYGALDQGEDAIQVTGYTTVKYGFARLFGIETVQVRRSATALASGEGRAGSGIFFAGETSSNRTGVTINGSWQYVDGTIHSNTKVTINGSSQTVMGDIEYRYSYTQNGSNFTLGGNWVQTTIQPYPVNFTWEQYNAGPFDYVVSSLSVNGSNQTVASGRWKVNGNMTINGTRFHASDCVFVVDGNITFNGSGLTLDRVTLVATGNITMNGTTERFSCFEDGNNLFAFSTKTSTGTVITVNGASSDTWGIIYAPNGSMVYNGSDQEIHHGALIAKTITVNGSKGRFCGMGEGGGGGERIVRLIR